MEEEEDSRSVVTIDLTISPIKKEIGLDFVSDCGLKKDCKNAIENYHAEVLVDKNSSHPAKRTNAPVSMMADPLEMQSSGEEDESQPSTQLKRKYRKRTTRSKQFEQSLKMAKKARLTLSGVHDVSETQKVFELNDSGNTRLVEMGEAPACNCTFGQGKNVCFHMIWVMLNVLKVNESDEILFQKVLTSGMVKKLFKNLAEDVSQERSGRHKSSGASSASALLSGGSLHDLHSWDKENSPRPAAAAHGSMTPAAGSCSNTDTRVSSESFLRELSIGRDNNSGTLIPENSSSNVMSFLSELESVSNAIPSASNWSMTSYSGTNSNSVMSSNSFGGDIQARPPAAHSSVNAVSVTSPTTFGGAHARPPAPHSSVNAVSVTSSSTIAGAYARPPAALSSVNSVTVNSPSTIGGAYARPPAPQSSVNAVSVTSSSTLRGAYARPPAALSSVNSVTVNSPSTIGGAYARPPAPHSSVNAVSVTSPTTFGGAYARPPAALSSVNSVTVNSPSTIGGAYARPPAPHSSVNAVSVTSPTTFGGAYARPPAAYSPVFTRPPWHNSNPFVVVNLNNKIKKCAGCPFAFRDQQGPLYLGIAVKHVEKDVYFDKASGTQRLTKEGNRYYHCQVSCITSRHPYFSTALLRADPELLLDDFQRYSLDTVFGVPF